MIANWYQQTLKADTFPAQMFLNYNSKTLPNQLLSLEFS